MKYLGVLCVSVFSAFKVIVTRGEQAERRGRRDAEHAEILHPSSFIPHPCFIGYTPREKENETTCIPEAKK
jgi:hypothetical protein